MDVISSSLETFIGSTSRQPLARHDWESPPWISADFYSRTCRRAPVRKTRSGEDSSSEENTTTKYSVSCTRLSWPCGFL
jgi:hypothetical protein